MASSYATVVNDGLFLLLFAWPLNRVLRMTHDQITRLPDGRVLVTFDKVPIDSLRSSADRFRPDEHPRPSLLPVGNTAWLFPGRHPGDRS
jgi:hypothetical protein